MTDWAPKYSLAVVIPTLVISGLFFLLMERGIRMRAIKSKNEDKSEQKIAKDGPAKDQC
jgi:hypothetical protein